MDIFDPKNPDAGVVLTEDEVRHLEGILRESPPEALTASLGAFGLRAGFDNPGLAQFLYGTYNALIHQGDMSAPEANRTVDGVEFGASLRIAVEQLGLGPIDDALSSYQVKQQAQGGE